MSEKMTTWLDVRVRERNAVDAYNRDDRFRVRVMQIVSHAMHRHGPVNPEYADREAHDIATTVAAMMLQTVYEEDAEMRNLKAERDQYRKFAEECVGLRPMAPMFISADGLDLTGLTGDGAHKLITPAPSSDTKSDIAQPIQPPTVKGPETQK